MALHDGVDRSTSGSLGDVLSLRCNGCCPSRHSPTSEFCVAQVRPSDYCAVHRHCGVTGRRPGSVVAHHRGERPDMLEPADTALLADQLRNGDPEAFSKLLDLYGLSMLRVARGYVSSREQAEDVVQETWIAVFKGIDRFEGRASLRTWIFTILINVAKKHGMAERRHADTAVRVMTGGTVDPDRFRDAGDSYPVTGRNHPPRSRTRPRGHCSAVNSHKSPPRGCSRLPARQREVVTLRDVQGFSSEEVCRMLDISAANQRVLLHRGRAVVRQELKTTSGRPHERRRDHLRATRRTGDRLPRRRARSRRRRQVRRTPAGM